VSSLPASIVAAAALFAGTNVDDIAVLALLSAASRATGVPRRGAIWAGQYAGFALLVGVSLAAGRGLDLIPAGRLWLLALIPLTLGVVTLIGAVRTVRQGERPAPPSPGGVLGVAALTVTRGGRAGRRRGFTEPLDDADEVHRSVERPFAGAVGRYRRAGQAAGGVLGDVEDDPHEDSVGRRHPHRPTDCP
jgi:hypothetical protein